MYMNKLAQDIHNNARDHGFWETERNFGEMLMLVTSELAEALEEHRDGKPLTYYNAAGTAVSFDSRSPELLPHGRKPEGIAVELADVIIRTLDTMHSLGVDIEAVVGMKHNYNKSRPFKHGKAY